MFFGEFMNTRIVNIEEYFSVISDPRKSINKRHKLIDIIVISICATLSGCEDFTEISVYGESKEEWLKTFLELPNGIPSHDTFTRVFRSIDPDEFGNCFSEWVQALRAEVSQEVVAIDGKTIRRSFDKAAEKSALHVVSAFASENKLALGQVSVSDKSNEITAIPKLLKLLYLKGCIVTIDAMGCQKKIASAIREKKADYVLALKGNHPNLEKEVKDIFSDEDFLNKCDYHKTEDKKKSHGRLEVREYYITDKIKSLSDKDKWKDLKSIGMVKSSRTVNGKTSLETRYFICSIKPDSNLFAKAVRKHWSIENSLHWVLDVVFNEDYSRSRKDCSAHNLAALRKIALNLIRAENSTKGSIKVKRLRASLKDEYLMEILTNTKQENSNT
jgi:predicted transposase YbfD/YdcC